jgi:hypothetical protein
VRIDTRDYWEGLAGLPAAVSGEKCYRTFFFLPQGAQNP